MGFCLLFWAGVREAIFFGLNVTFYICCLLANGIFPRLPPSHRPTCALSSCVFHALHNHTEPRATRATRASMAVSINIPDSADMLYSVFFFFPLTKSFVSLFCTHIIKAVTMKQNKICKFHSNVSFPFLLRSVPAHCGHVSSLTCFRGSSI